MIIFGPEGPPSVIKTKLTGVGDIAMSHQLFYTEHNKPNPRHDAPNVSVAGVFSEEVINKMIGDAFSGSISKFCHLS